MTCAEANKNAKPPNTTKQEKNVLSSRYFVFSSRLLHGQSCSKFVHEVNMKVCEGNQYYREVKTWYMGSAQEFHLVKLCGEYF